MKNIRVIALVLITLIVMVAIAINKSPLIKSTTVYTTDTTAKSAFANGLAYFSVNQETEGKIGVKTLSMFQKMITETCGQMGCTVVTATPYGYSTMIDGEPAYSAMLITYNQPSIVLMGPPKKTL